jgi:cell division protein FtsQ
MVALTDGMGMRVADIFTEGRQRTGAAEIYRILEPYYGQNILSVDIAAIQQRLQSLPWVRDATVTRHLPDRLRTHLVEHRPIALWHTTAEHGIKETALVSDKGDIIRIAAVSPYRHLPVLSGAGAPAAAPELMRLIEAEPALARQVTGAERVDGRRWNVFIDGRIEVRLPERETTTAWSRLARLESEQALLARAVAAVDLRLADRVVVRLADEVVQPASALRPTALRPTSVPTSIGWDRPA